MEKKELTKNMLIGDVVKRWPKTAEVFTRHGMHCIGCAIAHFETIEQGAKAHGMDIGKLIKDLNEKIRKEEG